MKIIIFGAGKVGKYASQILRRDGYEVMYFVDNAPEKWNTHIWGICVISFAEYLKITEPHTLILALNDYNREQIVEQLESSQIKQFEVFEEKNFLERERLFSCSYPQDMEDVILYNALYNEKEIFYIDIGSNDPVVGSVTKLLYELKGAHGINVEPQKHLVELTNRERPRDINLDVGVGEKNERKTFFLQHARSTLVDDNVIEGDCPTEDINIVTLSQICDEYVPENQKISFLKIDVEGYERQVLLGANFEKYRPEIVLVEATEPETMDYNVDKWEYILLQNNYHFVFTHGVNRYYVANEKKELDSKFLDVQALKYIYRVYQVSFEVLK